MDVHTWFGLSYANFLVLPRIVLQSMPEDWQERFVALVEEAEHTFACPAPYAYRVSAVDEHGRFVKDPTPHYNRGRARLFPRGHVLEAERYD